MSGIRSATLSALLFACFAFAFGLAAAPQLHDQLHHGDATHQCAATLLSSGSVEHSDCEPAPTAPQLVPVDRSFPAVACPRLVVRLASSLLEHAPPALS